MLLSEHRLNLITFIFKAKRSTSNTVVWGRSPSSPRGSMTGQYTFQIKCAEPSCLSRYSNWTWVARMKNQCIQTATRYGITCNVCWPNSQAQPASSLMSGSCFRKLGWPNADNSKNIMPKLWISGAIPLLPHVPYWYPLKQLHLSCKAARTLESAVWNRLGVSVYTRILRGYSVKMYSALLTVKRNKEVDWENRAIRHLKPLILRFQRFTFYTA